MIGKLYSVLAFCCIAAVLAGGGLAAYLYFTGKLDAQRIEAIAGVLRGEAAAVDATAAAATQPAARPGEGRSTAEEIREQRRRDEVTRALAERAVRDVAARQDLLDQAARQVLAESEQLKRDRADWKAQQDVALAAAERKKKSGEKDDGFDKELKLVAGLPPAAAKEHLIRTWKKRPPDAVRLINGLSTARVTKILEQFKTPEEQQIMHELLEQLRHQDSTSTPAPGTGPGDAS